MKNQTSILNSYIGTECKSEVYNSWKFFKGFSLMLVMTLAAMGCDSIVDQQTETNDSIATGDMSVNFPVVAGAVIDCIKQDEPEYNVVHDMKTVEWGKKKNPFTKRIEIEFYNTLTEFVLRVKSSHAFNDVIVDDESVKNFNGRISAGSWQEFTFELDEDWQAGDEWSFAVKVAGSGPPAELDVNYVLIGECVTTCGEDNTFLYDGVEVTYGTVTGANNSCWHDRNLGAARVSVSGTDVQSYGDYFMFDEALNACPVGFRIATESEWETERLSWISNNAAGAFASPLKLSVPGFRSNSSLISAGTAGVYWSSTVFETFARTLYFGSTESYMFSGGRFVERTVRCIKD